MATFILSSGVVNIVLGAPRSYKAPLWWRNVVKFSLFLAEFI